jgi:hypothetical protein
VLRGGQGRALAYCGSESNFSARTSAAQARRRSEMEPASIDSTPRILGFEHMILQVADIEA